MLKRILAVVLSFCMVLQSVPVTAYAAENDAGTVLSEVNTEAVSDNVEEGGEEDGEVVPEESVSDNTSVSDNAPADDDLSEAKEPVPEEETTVSEEEQKEVVSDEEEITEEPIEVTADTGTTLELTLGEAVAVSGVSSSTGQWISFTAPADALYTFWSADTTQGDPYGILYSQKEENDDYRLTSNDDGAGYPNFKMSYELTAGTTVYLFARSYGAGASYNVYVAKPGSNGKETLTLSEGGSVSVSGVNQIMWQWVSFTAPEAGIYEISYDSDSLDGDTPYFYALEEQNDASASTIASGDSIVVTMAAGQTCYVRAMTESGTAMTSYDVTCSKLMDDGDLNVDLSTTPSSIDYSVSVPNEIFTNLGGLNVYVYYREAGTETWTQYTSYYLYSGSNERSGKLSYLSSDTEYEVEFRYTSGDISDGNYFTYHEAIRTKAVSYTTYTIGEYTVYADITPVFGGFALNTKVEKGEETGSDTLYAYVRRTGETEWQNVGSRYSTYGNDVTWSEVTRLDVGTDYEIKFEIGGSDNEASPIAFTTLDIGTEWAYEVIYGYKRLIVDFSDMAARPSVSTIDFFAPDGTSKYASWHTTGEIGYCNLQSMVLQENTEAKLRLSYKGRDGYKSLGEVRLKNAESITATADLGNITYDISSYGMNVPVTVSGVAAEVNPGLKIVFETETDNYNSGDYRLEADTEVNIPISRIKAKSKGALKAVVYEDVWLGRGPYTSWIEVQEIELAAEYTSPASAHTAAVELGEVGIADADISFEIGNRTSTNESLTAEFLYATEADAENGDWQSVSGINLNYSNAYSYMAQLTGLEPGTKYLYKIYLYKSGYRINVYDDSTYTFTTKPLSELTADVNADTVYTAGAGVSAVFNTRIGSNTPTFSYRKVGEGDWTQVTNADVDNKTATALITGLEPENEYQYKVAFYGVEFSEGRLTGTETDVYKTFTTKTVNEAKSLFSSAKAEPAYTSSLITSVFTEKDESLSVVVSVRKEGSGEEAWTTAGQFEAEDAEQQEDNTWAFKCSVSGLLIGTAYEYKVAYALGGTELEVLKTDKFTTKVPTLTTQSEAQSYYAKVVASSKEMGEVSDIEVVLLYSAAEDFNPAENKAVTVVEENTSGETPAWSKISVNSDAFDYNGYKNTYTYTYEMDSLLAETSYKYGVYLVSGDTYVVMDSGSFTTDKIVNVADYSLTDVKVAAGYSYNKINAFYDSKLELVRGIAKIGDTEETETLYEAGYVLTYKDANGGSVRENIEADYSTSGHSLFFYIQKQKDCTDYKVTPYVTIKAGKEGTATKINGSELSLSFHALETAQTKISAQALEIGTRTASLQISGSVTPTYMIPDGYGAYFDGENLSDGLVAEISYWTEATKESPSTVSTEVENGEFFTTVSLDYAETYQVKAVIKPYTDNGESKETETLTVTTSENFIDATVSASGNNGAIALLRTKNRGVYSGINFALAKKSDGVTFDAASDTFSDAFANNLYALSYQNQGIDVTSGGYLSSAVISGLEADTEYVYAFAVMGDNGYVYKAGGSFTTEKNLEATKVSVAAFTDANYNSVDLSGIVINPESESIEAAGYEYKLAEADEWTSVYCYDYDAETGKFTAEISTFAEDGSVILRPFASPENFDVVYGEEVKVSTLKISDIGSILRAGTEVYADAVNVNAGITVDVEALKDLPDSGLYLHYQWKKAAEEQYAAENAGYVRFYGNDRNMIISALEQNTDYQILLTLATASTLDEQGANTICTLELPVHTKSIDMDMVAVPYMSKVAVYGFFHNLYGALSADAGVRVFYKASDAAEYTTKDVTAAEYEDGVFIDELSVNQTYQIKAEAYIGEYSAATVFAATVEKSITTGDIGTSMVFGDITATSACLYAVVAPIYNAEGDYTIDLRYRKAGTQDWVTLENIATVSRTEYRFVYELTELEAGTEYEVEADIKSDTKVLDTVTGISLTTPEEMIVEAPVLTAGSITEVEEARRTSAVAVNVDFEVANSYVGYLPVTVNLYKGEDLVDSKEISSYVAYAAYDENQIWRGYAYHIEDVTFSGLEANTAYTVKAQIPLGAEAATEIGTLNVTTLEDIAYNLEEKVPDANLRAVLVNKLGLTSSQIMLSQIEEVTSLSITRRDLSENILPIQDLSGLEIFKYLTRITINDQDITNADVLSQLTELTYVYLQYNLITSIPDLRNSTNLSYFNIAYNMLSNADVSGIARNRKVSHADTIYSYGQRKQSDLIPYLDVYALRTISGLMPRITLNLYGVRQERAYSVRFFIDDEEVATINKAYGYYGGYYRGTRELTAGKHTVKAEITPADAFNKAEMLVVEKTITVDEPVQFADANLEAIVKQLCEEQDCAISELTELVVVKTPQDTAIASLEGIEYLTSLQTLIIRGHDITDASAVAGLRSLETLDLSYNKLTTLPNLELCSNIRELDFKWNYINKKEFHANNYKIPDVFRNSSSWLKKQAECQRSQDTTDTLLLEVENTYAAAGENLNIGIRARGLTSDQDYTLTIKEGDKVIASATDVEEMDETGYPYHDFMFADVKLSEGEHTLLFEVEGIDSVTKTVTIKKNVIVDETLRAYIEANFAGVPLDRINSIQLRHSGYSEPITTVKGISYLSNLTSLTLIGEDLDNSEAAGLEELALLPKLELVNLVYNNLTEVPKALENVDNVYLSYNLIAGEKNQRSLELTKADKYYLYGDTSPLYVEVDGLRPSYRDYQVELSKDGITVAELEQVSATEERCGFYVRDTKLPVGEHNVTLVVYDHYGKEVYKQETVITYVEPEVVASLYTPDRERNNELSFYITALYVGIEEVQSVSLSDKNGNQIYLAESTKLRNVEINTNSYNYYPQNVFKNTTWSNYLSSIPVTGIWADLVLDSTLADGEYILTVNTSARTLSKEVRFGVDGDRFIDDVYVNEAYDNTGDYIYITVEGYGLIPSMITPVLYSKEGAVLTKDAVMQMDYQIAGNMDIAATYRLTKTEEAIWAGRSNQDSLYTQGNSIRYEIVANSGYELDATGSIAGYVSYGMSNGLKLIQHVLNHRTGQLEAYFEEHLSSSQISATINGYRLTTAISNGVAYFDLKGISLPSGSYRVTYQLTDSGSSTSATLYVYEPYVSYGSSTADAYIWAENSVAEGTTEISYSVQVSSEVMAEDSVCKVVLSKAGGTLAETGITFTQEESWFMAEGILKSEIPLVSGIYDINLQIYNEDSRQYEELTSTEINVYSESKVLVRRTSLYSEYLFIFTPNAEVLDVTKLALKITTLDLKTEEKAVNEKDLYIAPSYVYINLESYLPKDKACWVDVEFDNKELYSADTPELEYYKYAVQQGIEDVHKEYGFYIPTVDWLGFYANGGTIYGVLGNSSNLPLSITISDAQDVKVYKTLTANESDYFFSKTDLKNLDLSKVYRVSVEDARGNKSYEIGNIGIYEKPSSITLNKQKLVLNLADSSLAKAQLTATVNGGSDLLAWTVENSSVARVNQYGYVEAVGVGTTKVTVASAILDSVNVSCEVTVADFEVVPENGRIMFAGDSQKLVAYFNGEEKTEGVTYVSYAPNVVSVSAEGIVTAKHFGSAVVAAKCQDTVYYVRLEVGSKLKAVTLTIDEHPYYPAIESNGTYQIKQYEQYEVHWYPSPADVYTGNLDLEVFYTSSNVDVAAVDLYNGTLTAVAPGKAEITINVVEGSNTYTDTITIEVLKDAYNPEIVGTEVPTMMTVLTNVNQKCTLGTVTLPEGWRWDEDLNTMLYSDTWLDAWAVFEKPGYYPDRSMIRLYVGTVAAPTVEELYGRKVITKTQDGKDGGLLLDVTAVGSGYVYSWDFDVIGDTGLEVEYLEDEGVYKVEAAQNCTTGPHTITVNNTFDLVDIYWDSSYGVRETYTTTTQLTYQVVEGRVVDKILVWPEGASSSTQNLYMEKGATRKLVATAYDQWGEEIENPTLNWASSDTKVASVKGKDSTVEVAAKENGYAKITVAAKDEGGQQTTVVVTVRNYEPHVEGGKVSVNTAVDYESIEGLNLADTVTITPAYGYSLSGEPVIVTGNTEDSAVSEKFRLVQISGGLTAKCVYAVVPMEGVDVTKADAGKYYIRTRNNYGSYYAPLTINVVTKAPSITVGQDGKLNLFYRDGENYLTIKGKEIITGPEVEWSKQPNEDMPQGFVIDSDYVDEEITKKGEYVYYYPIEQYGIELNAKNKLPDNSITKGTLTITVPGYKEPITKAYTIKTYYKAPTYTIYSDQSAAKGKNSITLCPELGVTQDEKAYVTVMAPELDGMPDWANKAGYDFWDFEYVTVNNKNTVITARDNQSYMTIAYNGKKSTSTVVTFHNDTDWRGVVNVKLKINVAKPTVALSRSTITLNKNYPIEKYYSLGLTSFIVKGYGVQEVDSISISADAKAQALLDGGSLLIKYDEGELCAALSDDTALKASVKAGNYKYKITPYYRNDAGELVAMKAVTLTVKITDKKAEATVKLSGKLDLVKERGWIDAVVNGKNYIKVTPKISNLDAGDYIEDMTLNGAYSDSFGITYMYDGYYYIYLESGSNLRAKQSYKLSITCEMSSGIEVTTKEFTIKPIQSVPKVTVSQAKVQLHASSSGTANGTQVQFSVPEGYQISSITAPVTNGIVTRWDGSGSERNTGYALFYIQNGPDAKASAKGVNTKVKLTVKLIGRDGVSKDATATVTVNVKR